MQALYSKRADFVLLSGYMNQKLFNVAIKEEGADDYTGQYRVLQVMPVHYPNKKVNGFFSDCDLLVVTPNKKLRIVSYYDCLFLGF